MAHMISPAAKWFLGVVALAVGVTGAFAQKKGTGSVTAAAEAEIKPPFNLAWHEPQERLEGKIKAAKLIISERRSIEGREALTVTGFKKPDPKDPKAPKPPELQRAVFYFVRKEMVEVELQYEQPGWEDAQYGTCLGEKRQMLERIYGTGQQIVRTSTPTPDGKATQTMVGYKWNRNNIAVELIYFSVNTEGDQQAFRTLSLHYKL